MSRQEFSAKVKAAAFLRANGRCESCTARLYPGKFAFDHVLPDGLGGAPVIENCAVLCSACHGAKTASRDVPQIAKMKRQRIKHLGAKSKRAWPGTDKWKRKINGETVRR
jgi:5-methylcytosine-specific restriction enzyme A